MLRERIQLGDMLRAPCIDTYTIIGLHAVAAFPFADVSLSYIYSQKVPLKASGYFSDSEKYIWQRKQVIDEIAENT